MDDRTEHVNDADLATALTRKGASTASVGALRRGSQHHTIAMLATLPIVQRSGSLAGGIAVTRVPLAELAGGLSPRSRGEDREHVRRLAEVDGPLPPILVHRATMRVIDGMHRLRAAQLQCRADIEVVYYDGSDDEAFALAVQLNVAHGLPLTLADRRTAAARIMSATPEWSDRKVAALTGLSPKTVGAVRRSSEEIPHLNSRLGRDGRVRAVPSEPASGLGRTTPGRRVSLATRSPSARPCAQPTGDLELSGNSHLGNAAANLLAVLQKDPSIHLRNAGRTLLRAFSITSLAASQSEDVIVAMPRHQSDVVANLARACSAWWLGFAERVESDTRDS